MTHLLVHLVREIDILGPVFQHNMFPFERFMGVLKKCVRNHARPEGSIASAYGTEEVIDFCVDFIDDLKPIGVPESRYEGRLNGKGTLGKKSHICTDDDSFKKAHYAVLQQSSLVDPYIEEHKKILTSEFPEKSVLGSSARSPDRESTLQTKVRTLEHELHNRNCTIARTKCSPPVQRWVGGGIYSPNLIHLSRNAPPVPTKVKRLQ